MAMRCHVKIGTYRTDDVMKNEKWSSSQKEKGKRFELKKFELTEEYLTYLCNLVKPNYSLG